MYQDNKEIYVLRLSLLCQLCFFFVYALSGLEISVNNMRSGLKGLPFAFFLSFGMHFQGCLWGSDGLSVCQKKGISDHVEYCLLCSSEYFLRAYPWYCYAVHMCRITGIVVSLSLWNSIYSINHLNVEKI